MLEFLIQKVQARSDLTESEAQAAIGQIMEGKVPAEQVKTFLLALRAKGEALSEVVGAARAMRAHAVSVKTVGVPVVDTCGTGGDGLHTLNFSTLAALVVAGAGVPVAKHGNRSITSSCGSADLLEALGVRIDVEPPVVQRCIEEANFGFLFAPRFHPAMKAVASIRKELAVPTLFNLLGPLTNPAGVRHQVVGVADLSKLDLYAEALRILGSERALVVHGADGQDEISTTGLTEIAELNVKQDAERIARYRIVPETFGIQKATLQELKGGSPQENAKVAQEVLSGRSGPVKDAVLFNAAAALYVAGSAGDIEGGLSLARQSLDRGKAREVLERLKGITNDPTT